MELTFEEKDKFSDKLEINDEFQVGGLLCRIDHISIDFTGDLVLHLEIVGATKKKSKARLILPKRVPITTLK